MRVSEVALRSLEMMMGAKTGRTVPERGSESSLIISTSRATVRISHANDVADYVEVTVQRASGEVVRTGIVADRDQVSRMNYQVGGVTLFERVQSVKFGNREEELTIFDENGQLNVQKAQRVNVAV